MISFKKQSKNQKKIEPKLELTAEKLGLSNLVTIEALVEVLVEKGVVTREEILSHIRDKGKHIKTLKEHYDKNPL